MRAEFYDKEDGHL